MNVSIKLLEFFVILGFVSLIGLKAQKLLLLSQSIASVVVLDLFSLGSAAPFAIHSLMLLIAVALSFPLGGIFKSP